MSGKYADEGYAKEAVGIAEAVLAGSVSIIDGCRRLWKPLYKNFVEDEPSFAVISEVCAKVSTFPMPEDRHLWDQNVVRVKDAELAEWLPSVQERVLAACREIVQRFGDAG